MADWRERAACRKVDPDIFHPDPGGTGDLAIHICRLHCPVAAECGEWSRGWAWAECVIAGERWIQACKGRPSRVPPKAVKADECPLCVGLVVHPALSGLRPCGTHAAYVRHRDRGGEPCAECAEAERTYQRTRKRRIAETGRSGTAS